MIADTRGSPVTFNISPLDRSDLSLGPVQSAFMTAVELLEAGRASLLLRDSVEPILLIAAFSGIEPRVADQIQVPVGRGIAGVVAERGIALFGNFDGATFLSIPVLTDQGIEGVLNVTDRAHGKQYTTEHLALGTSAARHIGHLLQYGRTAVRDPVSGLPNRRAFEEVLDRELALGSRTGTTFSVVFLDLDNLKSINDHLGHARGDEVIRGVGTCLHRILRPYDFAGRLGGDEFVLLLSRTTEPEGSISSRIADAMAHLATEMGTGISTSVGVARYPQDGTSGPDLISAADARMYEHKRAKKLLMGVRTESS